MKRFLKDPLAKNYFFQLLYLLKKKSLIELFVINRSTNLKSCHNEGTNFKIGVFIQERCFGGFLLFSARCWKTSGGRIITPLEFEKFENGDI